MRRWRWLAAAVAALIVAVPVGTFVYIHFVEGKAPAKLSLATDSTRGANATTGSVPAGGISGTWRPTPASTFGYRVKEILFGQDNEAVGRTHQVTGTMTVDGSTVKTVKLVVDLTSVSSDQSRRDNQFRGRIMQVSTFPTATFELTQPVELPRVPADTTPLSVPAVGNLTLRGTTKPVNVTLRAQRDGATIKVNGTIPITFADWGIPNPSFGPVSTEDHGQIELLVVFERGA